jgi:splicing factor 3B subunit 3
MLIIFSPFPKIRLSGNITDDVDEDPTGNKALWDRGLLNGASQKAGIVANFHVGEICMSLQVILVVNCTHYS